MFIDFIKEKLEGNEILKDQRFPLIIALIFYLLPSLPYGFPTSISYWGAMVAMLYWTYLRIRYRGGVLSIILGVLFVLHFLRIIFKF